jgi:hypothetical protein
MIQKKAGTKHYLLPLVAVLMALLACGPLDTAGEIIAGLFRVYYVAPDGSDTNDCRSWENACLTISAAARHVDDGDIIRVAAGTVSVPDVTLDSIIAIEGMGEAATTLELTDTATFTLNVDVTFLDLTITTSEPTTGGVPCIYVATGASTTITQVTLQHCGMGIEVSPNAEANLENVTVTGSNVEAIFNDQGIVTVQRSRLIDNNDRAITNTGTMSIENTTIDHNLLNPWPAGGDLARTTITNAGHLELINSTISRSMDRGITNGGELILRNSTISSNRGDVAISSQDGELRLQHVTVANNAGTGINIIGGLTEIENTIVSGNGYDCYWNPAYTPTLLGVNISENCRSFTSGDLLLQPLADNGGPTETHALQPGSAAIDAATLECPPIDQRGVARPFGDACDAGAFEFDPTLDAESIALQAPATLTAVTPAMDLPQADVMKDSLCWRGPGTGYPVVSSVSSGATLTLLGVDSDGNWLIVDSPRFPGVNCWLERNAVSLSPETLLSELPVFPIPPLPTATPKPESALGCLVQDPNDPKQLICVPRACTPNDVPGGSCNP